MPWDGTKLRIANIDESGNLVDQKVCAGSETEAVNSPVWSTDGILYFISDASGFWNVWELDSRLTKRQLISESAEWAHPMWQVGTHLLRILASGELVGVHGNPAFERIAIIDPKSGSWRDLECDLTNFSHLQCSKIIVSTQLVVLQKSLCRASGTFNRQGEIFSDNYRSPSSNQ
jgi:hypothetical protein